MKPLQVSNVIENSDVGGREVGDTNFQILISYVIGKEIKMLGFFQISSKPPCKR